MKKRIEFKGQLATIQVDLNYEIEKHPNGVIKHRAIVSGFNCDYDQVVFEDASNNLEDFLVKLEADFMDWAENNPKEPTPNEAILQSLGYSKD